MLHKEDEKSKEEKEKKKEEAKKYKKYNWITYPIVAVIAFWVIFSDDSEEE